MSGPALQHRRIHNLLLVQKLLSLREGTSPFTLVLDTIEQSARPLIRRYIRNAKVSQKTNVVFVAFETHIAPPDVTKFIKASGKDTAALQTEIRASSCSPPSKKPSLLAIYHTDVPVPPSPGAPSPYAPSALTTLRYLATTILTIHSFQQSLARKRAAERSLPEPLFGLAEEREGVLVGLQGVSGGRRHRGEMVVEMEYRRKSGRAVEETYYFPPPSPLTSKEKAIVLLDDHPEYTPPKTEDEGVDAQAQFSTFELGLTDKQRREREGVVLPYYDAQKDGGGGGPGDGGRILYDMGVEDDFDEEEDEI
ncbi:MAG: hypothetical protein Q9163_002885 [Psora crenata]